MCFPTPTPTTKPTFKIGQTIELTQSVNGVRAGYRAKINHVDPYSDRLPVRVQRPSDTVGACLLTSIWPPIGTFKVIEIDDDGFELAAFNPTANRESEGFMNDVPKIEPLFSGVENMSTLVQNGERLNVHVVSGVSQGRGSSTGHTANVSAVYKRQGSLALRFQVVDTKSITEPSQAAVFSNKFEAILTAPDGDTLGRGGFDSLLAAVKWCARWEFPADVLPMVELYALIAGEQVIGG